MPHVRAANVHQSVVRWQARCTHGRVRTLNARCTLPRRRTSTFLPRHSSDALYPALSSVDSSGRTRQYSRTFPSASSSSLCVLRLAACSRSSDAISCLLMSCSRLHVALACRRADTASSACLVRVSATSFAAASAAESTC